MVYQKVGVVAVLEKAIKIADVTVEAVVTALKNAEKISEVNLNAAAVLGNAVIITDLKVKVVAGEEGALFENGKKIF